jgi:hypothetical protein
MKLTDPVRNAFLLAGLLAAASLTAQTPAAAPAPAPAAKPLTAERTALVSVTATVTAINHDTRELTLKGPDGNEITTTVDTAVTRFNEVRVGDKLTVDYYISLAGELRAPTEAEKANPFVMVEGAAKAPPNTAPAGGMLRVIKAVTTVVSVDTAKQELTLKGPQGRLITVESHDPAKLAQVHVGDTIMVTYTEALAISMKLAPDAPVK